MASALYSKFLKMRKAAIAKGLTSLEWDYADQSSFRVALPSTTVSNQTVVVLFHGHQDAQNPEAT
jgi:hypothetical protein